MLFPALPQWSRGTIGPRRTRVTPHLADYGSVVPKRASAPLRARLQPRIPDDLAPVAHLRADDGEIDWSGVGCDDVAVPREVAMFGVASAWLRNVRFTGCDIEHFDACDVVFEECELSGALVSGARMERVEFRRCRMSGVELSMATLRDVGFDECRLDEANLRAATLVAVDAVDCELRNADLYGATIERSNILRSNLTGADFSHCRLERLLLHGSTVIDVKGGAALAGAIISRDQIVTLAPSVITSLGIVVDDDFHDAATPT